MTFLRTIRRPAYLFAVLATGIAAWIKAPKAD
jgi:hypothetical protein